MRSSGNPYARYVRHGNVDCNTLRYPDRIAGEQIDLLARIVAVADSYDAMTSSRPYRTVLRRVDEGAGTQLPNVC